MPPKKISKAALGASRAVRRRSTRQKQNTVTSPYFDHLSEDKDDDATSDFQIEKIPSYDKSNSDSDKSQANTSLSRKRRQIGFSGPIKNSKRSTEIFIPLRAPSPGEIDYAENRIHPNTFIFLKDLSENNERAWLRERDGIYRAAKADFEKFVDCVTAIFPEKVDDTIPELPVKDLVFRIHRDIRFSNDLTPYKTYFSAAWSRTGRKGPYACYYLQIEPGQSLAGGGLWHPEAQALHLIRTNIDRHPERLKRVLTSQKFVAEFFGNVPGADENKIVELFAERNGEDALKTAPKNFPKDHRDIVLLRLRSFTIGKKLSDEDVVAPDFLDHVARIFNRMEPFITYLNSCVMPDFSAESANGGN